MKFTACVATAVLALFSSTASAVIQSKPFYLVLHSSNSTLNGKALGSCHEGAAIEGLCLGVALAKAKPASDYTFRFNYTHSEPRTGLLIYDLPVTGANNKKLIESEPYSLYVDPGTNVALGLFEPGYLTTYVSFDSSNLMYIQSSVDDLQSPPTDDKVRNLYRWQMCEYDFESYTYEVLCWQQGSYPPENPTCQHVGVERVFSK